MFAPEHGMGPLVGQIHQGQRLPSQSSPLWSRPSPREAQEPSSWASLVLPIIRYLEDRVLGPAWPEAWSGLVLQYIGQSERGEDWRVREDGA